jgi:hypothetical protein
MYKALSFIPCKIKRNRKEEREGGRERERRERKRDSIFCILNKHCFFV